MNFLKRGLIFILTALIILTLSQCCVAEAKVQDLQKHTIVYYGALQADLFSVQSKKATPAVILIHGGYWTGGSRQQLSDFATELARNGFLAMTVDLHSLPQYSQETQTNDVTNAVWWLRENSKKFGINPDKIGVVGISSGGYLAAWAATHDKVNQNKTHSIPNAAVVLYGPWDLTKEAEKEVSPDSGELIEKFCAGLDRTKASPLYAISTSIPPVLLIHGDEDKIVPVSQSLNAYRQIKSVHGKCKLEIVRNDGHCFPNTNSYFNAMKRSVKFLNRVLK